MRNKQNPILPFNYQYELSSWIYKIISKADEEYAHFLHQNGYESNKKSFKFFCFSNLFIPQYKIIKDVGFLLQTRQLELQVGFYVDKVAEKFVSGLFQYQRGSIGTRESQVDFMVQRIETAPVRIHQERVKLKTLSPLVVAQKNEQGHKDYLHPLDKPFKELLLRNLIEKYKAADKEIPLHWQNYPFVLEVDKKNIRSKLITIKQGTPQATHVRGYLFEFLLQAPKELLEIGLSAGFGNENAQGFGMCEVVE
ncbi:MAG: CRISPR-associated endoribonuclease Cas6 [Bacteroidia bacterium]|nr:CRISPR-associated endoribonuclease Cas6 [Bacteroidia bacterium]